MVPQNISTSKWSTYGLSTVINHIGESANSGHYNIVIVDSENNKLILLDDSEMTEKVHFDEIMAQQSYVATYTRIWINYRKQREYFYNMNLILFPKPWLFLK